jgi:hypothetical protein
VIFARFSPSSISLLSRMFWSTISKREPLT